MCPDDAYAFRAGWTAEEHEDHAERLAFVQVALGCLFAGSMFDLVDLAPVTTVCGSGEARTTLGHVTTSAFLDLWWQASQPPFDVVERHAVLSFPDPCQQPWGDIRLVLRDPRIFGSGLRYDVRILRRVLPPKSGACVLLIEPANTPRPSGGTRDNA